MKPIDPLNTLAISMHAHPKRYALLLGSGVSKSVGVLTGWEVLLDLVRKMMDSKGVDASDPYQWYCDTYGTEPDYSNLMKHIAPTPGDRQLLLRGYWKTDQTDAEDSGGRIQGAHRAIADLVRREFVKVIVTTNFDRLIEDALREAGVQPAVLASPEDIEHMVPLDHISSCVVKLHGDYMDGRMLNTREELSEYAASVNKLLDRIFGDYGLLVCGWSGTWDVALNKALCKATKRYTMYWAVYGDLGPKAEHIIKVREGQIINIEGADQFFSDLSACVNSLGDHDVPSSRSIDATVMQCKRFLSHDQHRIQLFDLIDSVGKDVLREMAELPEMTSLEGTALVRRMERYESICSRLLATAVVASYWSNPMQLDAWRATVERFFQKAPTSGPEEMIAVGSYPAALLMYALGIGSVASGQLEKLGKILNFTTGRDAEVWVGHMVMRMVTSCEGVVADALNMMMLSSVDNKFKDAMRHLEGMERRYHVPMNDSLYIALRKHTREIPLEGYERTFDKMEVLIGLGCGVRLDDVRNARIFYTVGDFYEPGNQGVPSAPAYRPWFPVGRLILPERDPLQDDQRGRRVAGQRREQLSICTL